MSQVEALPVSESFVPDADIIKKTKELHFESDPTSYVLPVIDEGVSAAVPVQDEDVVFAEEKEDSESEEDPMITRSMGMADGGPTTRSMGKIDSHACGFDHQSTITPTLTPPIEEVVEDASMASWMVEYITGFEIVQTGLKMVDTGLSITEKILHHLEPVRFTKPAIDRILSVRRSLRAVRHAGRRSARSGLESVKTIGEVSMVGFIAELLQVNLILSIFGFALTPAEEELNEEPVESEESEDEEDSIVDEDESETLAEKLSDEKMQEYNSSDDPDYEEASEASEDSLEYNSNAEEVVGEVEPSCEQEPCCEVEHLEHEPCLEVEPSLEDEPCCAPISETIVEELSDEKLRDYNSSEDSDYKAASGEDEASDESLEYSSNAEEEAEQEVEPVSETLVEELSDLKLRDYRSSEDEDYEVVSATSESEDGLEYNSNAEDMIEDKQGIEPVSETLVEELTDEKLEDYNSGEDPDFVVVSEASEGSEDSLEYSSNAEESHEEQDVEPVSETLVEELSEEKLLDYNSGEDADYVAASDVSEDSLEYSSNADESNDAEESNESNDAAERHDEEESN